MGSRQLSKMSAVEQSHERIKVPVMEERASSANRVSELAHPPLFGYDHPMGHGYVHPGQPLEHGIAYGYNHGYPQAAPPPTWQNRYMEANGFKGPMPNWEPASASSHFPATIARGREPGWQSLSLAVTTTSWQTWIRMLATATLTREPGTHSTPSMDRDGRQSSSPRSVMRMVVNRCNDTSFGGDCDTVCSSLVSVEVDNQQGTM